MTAIGVGDQVEAAAIRVDSPAELTVERLQAAWRDHPPSANPYYERNLAKMLAEEEAARA